MEARRRMTLALNDRFSSALASRELISRNPAAAEAQTGQAVSGGGANVYGRAHVPAQLSAKTLEDLGSERVELLASAVPKVTRYFTENNVAGLPSPVLQRLLELVRLPSGESAALLSQMSQEPPADVYGVPSQLTSELQLLNSVVTFWSTYSAYSPDDVMTLLNQGLSYRIQQVAVFPGMPLQIVRTSLLALGNLVGDTLETRLCCFRFGVMDVYTDLMRRCFSLGETVVSDLAWALVNAVRPLKDGITSGIEYLEGYPELLQNVVTYLQSHYHKRIAYYICWGLYYTSTNAQLFNRIPLETVVTLCLLVTDGCDDALTPAMRLLAKEVVLHEREPQALRVLIFQVSSRQMLSELASLLSIQNRQVRVAILEFVRNIVPFREACSSIIPSPLLDRIISCCGSTYPELMEVALDTLGGILSTCTDSELSYVCEKKVVHVLAKILGGSIWKNASPTLQSSLSKQVYYALNILDMIVEFSGTLADSTKHELLTEDLAAGISDVCTSIPTVEALGEKVTEHLTACQLLAKRELEAGQGGAGFAPRSAGAASAARSAGVATDVPVGASSDLLDGDPGGDDRTWMDIGL